ncbi:hypothetical protein [Capnocytophaga canis]|uniref:Uncharacterized protein n=1 Tax=Capnocytophaga canis TaxID=1848903 RepID=A0A0B7IJ58_9FLAO|nr:hypothetical protein [Capnocytophaga canis]CEN51935.1 hypothetical protein CCAND93_20046 [Capnocytophaga canis]
MSWLKDLFGLLNTGVSTYGSIETSRYQSRASEYAYLQKRQEAYNMQQAQNNNNIFLFLGAGFVFLFLILILMLIFNRK